MDAGGLVEGIARVVAVEGAVAWLEPEVTTSCSGCNASSACGSPGGMGTLTDRVKVRRFPLDNDQGFVVGERVVIGVQERALIKASMTAYAVPLVSMLLAASMTQWAMGRDAVTLGASLMGLALGFVVARFIADRLRTKGSTTLRFLRRADAATVSTKIHTEILRSERCKTM